MKKVLMYWNHICILHNEEKKFLAKAKENLLKQGVDLEIKFFGLGYASHMSEYLAEKNSLIPDIIISADLEVFEHKSLYNKLGSLHVAENWLNLKNSKIVKDLRRKHTLLPFLAIPLVCYTNDLEHCKGKTLPEIIKNEGFTFGGINNSAGKTITKIAMEQYDVSIAKELLDKASISDMPIGAFQSVRTKQNKTAVVPSLYALRADAVNTHLTTLKEGVFLLPSYFSCAKTIDETTGKTVMAEIINETICNMYSNNGNLIVCPDIKTDNKVEDGINEYCAVSQKFLDSFDESEFYEMYTERIKTARNLIAV